MTASERFFRRPLFWSFPAFAAGVTGASRLEPFPAAAAYAAVFFICASLSRRRSFAAAALLCAALCAGWALPHASPRPVDAAARRLDAAMRADRALIGGRVVSDVARQGRAFGGESLTFVLDVGRLWESAGSEPQEAAGLVRVTVEASSIDWAYGDTGVFLGRLERPPGQRNPGGFDARRYWETKGVRHWFYGGGDASQKRLERRGGCPVIRTALEAKRGLSEALQRKLPAREAAVLRAMILGEKDGLDRPLKRLFVETGTMHLLVVSGANVAFVIAIVWWLTASWSGAHRLRWLAALAAVWGYGLLVGWQPPVVRACLMATAMLAGRLAGGRRADPLNALGLAGLVMIALRPEDLGDAGFWLSCACVWGLAALYPGLAGPAREKESSWIRLAWRRVRELFWASLVCQAATLPILVGLFHAFPTYALATNLAAVPLAALVFACGSAYLCLCGWWDAPAWAAAPVIQLIQYLLKLLELSELLPVPVQVVGHQPGWVLAALAAGSLGILAARRPRSAILRAALAAAWACAVLAGSTAARDADRRFEMTMLDVGQGDAVFLRFEDGTTMLIDAGRGRGVDEGERTVLPFLRWSGVRRLDWAVISHPQDDHAGGFETVMDAIPVRRVVSAAALAGRMGPYEKLRRTPGARALEWSAGDRVREPAFELDVLSPPPRAPDRWNINELSLVLAIRASGMSLLLTGDAGERTFEALLERPEALEAGIFKAPHHGARQSKTSRRLAEAVRPRVSLISAGRRNPHGHPHPDTLAALAAVRGNRVYRSDRDGAVRVTAGPGGFTVEPARPWDPRSDPGWSRRPVRV